jgi:Leucine-rich repeat (LRR) protein
MDMQELRQVIAQAARDKSTKLDLSGQGLTELPPEVGQLNSLEWLYLNGNKLQSLPNTFWQLINLIARRIFENKLRSIPPDIGRLVELQELYIGPNELAELPR